jgi:amino acid transporter
MATIAMISMKVEKILFLSDCNETSQEWSLGFEDVHSRLKIIIIIIIIIILLFLFLFHIRLRKDQNIFWNTIR